MFFETTFEQHIKQSETSPSSYQRMTLRWRERRRLLGPRSWNGDDFRFGSEPVSLWWVGVEGFSFGHLVLSYVMFAVISDTFWPPIQLISNSFVLQLR